MDDRFVEFYGTTNKYGENELLGGVLADGTRVPLNDWTETQWELSGLSLKFDEKRTN